MSAKRDSAIILITFVVLLILGSIVYHNIESLTWVDSIYFTVITLTTIGYGDITPVTSTGKIFTIFFSLAGIAIVFSTIAIIGRHLFRFELRKKMRSLKENYIKRKTNPKK